MPFRPGGAARASLRLDQREAIHIEDATIVTKDPGGREAAGTLRSAGRQESPPRREAVRSPWTRAVHGAQKDELIFSIASWPERPSGRWREWTPPARWAGGRPGPVRLPDQPARPGRPGSRNGDP